MLYKRINESDLIDEFKSFRPDNFSPEGLRRLFDYLNDLSDDLGEDIELDVIAICCEYSEYSFNEVYQTFAGKDQQTKIDSLDDLDEVAGVLKECLESEGYEVVLELSEGFIVLC